MCRQVTALLQQQPFRANKIRAQVAHAIHQILTGIAANYSQGILEVSALGKPDRRGHHRQLGANDRRQLH